MFAALLLAKLALLPEPVVVDMIELNTYHNIEHDRLFNVVTTTITPQFDQAILWRWSKVHKRHVVAQWMIFNNYKTGGKLDGEPCVSYFKHGDWWHVTCWKDDVVWRMKTKVLRLEAPLGIDPERRDRQLDPTVLRIPYFSEAQKAPAVDETGE